jgi:hypothetical protein
MIQQPTIERSRRGSGRRRSRIGLLLLLLVVPLPLAAEGWCDLVFKDVLGEAASVIIARYRVEDGSRPSVSVQEVLKGACTDAQLDLDPDELARYRLKDGDQMVLALTPYHQPVRVLPAMGGCTPVSLLPIRNGKLRARERRQYDFSKRSLSLRALRAELLELLRTEP